jgi:hypothetical protein
MSCSYTPWRRGTRDQDWEAHFLLRATKGALIISHGDGVQVRDVLEHQFGRCVHIGWRQRLRDPAGWIGSLSGGPGMRAGIPERLRA